MPRSARIAPGGEVYHVLNRSAGRLRLFENDKDFLAFEHVIAAALERQARLDLEHAVRPQGRPRKNAKA